MWVDFLKCNLLRFLTVNEQKLSKFVSNSIRNQKRNRNGMKNIQNRIRETEK